MLGEIEMKKKILNENIIFQNVMPKIILDKFCNPLTNKNIWSFMQK